MSDIDNIKDTKDLCYAVIKEAFQLDSDKIKQLLQAKHSLTELLEELYLIYCVALPHSDKLDDIFRAINGHLDYFGFEIIKLV